MKKPILFFAFLFISANLFSQSGFETLFEKSGYVSTDNYNSTMSYFQKLSDSSEYAQMIEFGISPQGRKLYYLIADKEKNFNVEPDIANRVKPVIMIQNGIHAGEIEGKDASMLLMREILITKEKFNLLDKVKIVVVPIFNVDGHERRSQYNRINQNGPKEMGWRTTAQNLNLNRDYTKADAPEMKALLRLFKRFNPDIFIDTHTTDGADYQYTITYGIDTHLMRSENQKKWIENELEPFIEREVANSGFLISPYVSYVKGDFRNGIKDWISSPRFSHGYAALRNRIGILIETHMLKPYRERVFSTKSLLGSILRKANSDAELIVADSKEADELASNYYKRDYFPIKLQISERSDSFLYRGKIPYLDSSLVTGGAIKKYTNEPLNKVVPYYHYSNTMDSVLIPKAYIIPAEYSQIIDLLNLHGIKAKRLSRQIVSPVIRTKFSGIKFPRQSFEGRFMPRYNFTEFEDSVVLREGDFVVETAQPLLGLIIYLFEPDSPDSFLKWGFFNAVFERKEYFEMYSMEPIAEEMYENSPPFRREYDKRLKEDKEFASNPRQRLNFFFERSKYFDSHLNVYPIMKLENLID